jgi:predicted outer membrane repeat protein
MKFATKTGRVAAGGSLLVGGVGGALVLAPQAGAATTYTVTTTADSGVGSLRQAIDDANNNPGADIIVFDASSAGTITLTTGDVDIADDVTITGLGAADSIISGNNNSSIFFMYDSGAMLTISISALTLTDGSSGSGGAIYSGGNDLTLSSVVITGNEASGKGGGIYSGDTPGRDAQLTIIDSEISDNTAAREGGGFRLYGVGDVTITNTVISGNIAGINRTIGSEGGGASFYQVGNVSIDSSTFDQNTSGSDGGGLYANQTDSFTMTNSTVSGNQGTDGAGLALYFPGDVLIANSTIANNVGDSNVGDGGALSSRESSGDTRIMFCTISGNSAEYQTVWMTGLSGYGVDLTGTIISDNTTSSGSGTQALDLYLYGSQSSALTVSSSLIMGTTGGDSFTDGGGNVFGVSAQLGVLADNGGATFTMEPAAGSPAIDAGPSTWTAFTGDGFDQRGTPHARGYNGRPDIGAFEVQSGPIATTTTTTAPSSSSTTLLGSVDTTTNDAIDPVVPAFTG